MEIAWSQLQEEARRLTQDIGQSGREHHSLAKSRVMWDAIRAHGVPCEHREWVWPILLHEQARLAVLTFLSSFSNYLTSKPSCFNYLTCTHGWNCREGNCSGRQKIAR